MTAPSDGGAWASFGAFLGFGAAPPDAASAPAPRAKPLSPEDAALRDAKDQMKASVREMQRELRRMRLAEAKRIRAVKEHVEAGRLERGRVEARQLIGTRRAILRVERGCDRLGALDQQMQVMRTSVAVIKFTERAVAIMRALNGVTDVAAVAALAEALAHQTETLKLKNEAVEDALDDAFEDDGADELGDDYSDTVVFDQICEDCGIRQADAMPGVPAPAAAASVGTEPVRAAVAEGGPVSPDAPDPAQALDDDLALRLKALKRK